MPLLDFQPSPSFNQELVKRQDKMLDSGRLFMLSDLLSHDECKSLISLSTKIGFEPVDWEYSPEYRHCDRLVARSPSLASALWHRVRPMLVREDVHGVKPYGFFQEGTWRPIGVNECIRLTRYQEGHHFQPHRDGSFVETDENRSIYTLMVYLNSEGFEGGETRFFEDLKLSEKLDMCDYDDPYLRYRSGKSSKVEQPMPRMRGRIALSVTPRHGKALVFTHDVWHSGSEVTRGSKYILRTDIMFERVSFSCEELFHRSPLEQLAPGSRTELVETDPAFVAAEQLYQQSIKYQNEGDPHRSTDCYLRALDMQASLPSITRQRLLADHYSLLTSEECARLPHEVWCHVLSFLSLKELVSCALVSRSWRYLVRSGDIWSAEFARRYPSLWPIEAHNHTAVTKDWYTVFAQRFVAEHSVKVAVIDIGHCFTKASMSDTSNESSLLVPRIAPTAMMQVSGHYWGARSGHKQFYVGTDLLSEYIYRPSSLRTLVNDNAKTPTTATTSIKSKIKTKTKHDEDSGSSSGNGNANAPSLGVICEMIRWSFYRGLFVRDSAEGLRAVSPLCTPLLMSVPLAWEQDRELLHEIRQMLLFEVRVPYVCLQSESVLALASVDRMSGVAVITGSRFTSVTPVIDGRALIKHGRLFESSADTHQQCSDELQGIVAQEGQMLSFETQEARYLDRYFGSNSNNNDKCNTDLGSFAHDVISACPIEMQETLLQNVVLCGGAASFESVRQRFHDKLRDRCVSNNQSFSITVPDEPVMAIVKGGAKWASLSTSFAQFEDQTLRSSVTPRTDQSIAAACSRSQDRY